MPRRLVPLILLFAINLSATDGMFQGKVVEPPANQPATSGWIYIEGRNHALRRVEVSHAAIVFGSEVPKDQRRKCGVECLTPGQEVRVTAEQDSSGEWRAKRIEILKLSRSAGVSEAESRRRNPERKRRIVDSWPKWF